MPVAVFLSLRGLCLECPRRNTIYSLLLPIDILSVSNSRRVRGWRPSEESETSKLISVFSFQLPEAEQEELMVIRSRLLSRVTTVDVTVLTPRTQQQAFALTAVNEILDKLLTRFQTEQCRHECERYLNSCLSDPTGPIDEKFQSKVS